MSLWQDLDCKNYNEINQEILNWIDAHCKFDNSSPFWNPIDAKGLILGTPKFQQWLADHKLFVANIAVTYGTSAECCGAHVDTPPARYKLSWPVKNTTGSYNRWFKEINVAKSFTNSLGGKEYRDYSDLEEIARRELLTPCLIDAGVPHDVWYKDASTAVFPRVGLQCQLMKEPSEL